MQRWEYLTLVYSQSPNGWVWLDNNSMASLPERFNEFGAQGWELVAVSEDIEWGNSAAKQCAYLFKRPY